MSQHPFQNELIGEQPSAKNAKSKKICYRDYLALDKLLDGQKTLSESPDEMLFIIQHQTSELWMKLLIHELTRVTQSIISSQLLFAMRVLDRAQRVLEHLTNAWDVLGTLSPSEFLVMRPCLGSASGHQSTQFLKIEFILGNKRIGLLQNHLDGHVNDYEELRQTLFKPSLYEEVVRELARQGLPISPERMQVDVTLSTECDETVQQAWMTVYQNVHDYFHLYSLAEKLIAFEDTFRLWRFRHVSTAEKMIGMKTGTAGSSGVEYLRKTLNTVFFPELWQLRTKL